MKVLVDDRFDARVAEAEDLVDRGEDDYCNLGPTEDAELARLLEQASPSLREGDLRDKDKIGTLNTCTLKCLQSTQRRSTRLAGCSCWLSS